MREHQSLKSDSPHTFSEFFLALKENKLIMIEIDVYRERGTISNFISVIDNYCKLITQNVYVKGDNKTFSART